MWHQVKRADFDRVNEQLKLRREETLRRHAEEISILDAEQAEVEALDGMVAKFARQFKTAAVSPSDSSDREEQVMPGDADEGATASTEPAPRYLSATQIWPSRVA
jgi:hypothetical protein